jgi:hypothetical protein
MINSIRPFTKEQRQVCGALDLHHNYRRVAWPREPLRMGFLTPTVLMVSAQGITHTSTTDYLL